jgi:hypothetical protein
MEAKLSSESSSIIEKAQVSFLWGFKTHETAAEANIFQLIFQRSPIERGGIHLLRRTCSLWQANHSKLGQEALRS